MNTQHTPQKKPVQTIIEGVQPPPPPEFGKVEVIKELVRFIEEAGYWSDIPAEESATDIAKHWRTGIDGYELAKDLENHEGWCIDAQDVEELDSIDSVIRSAKTAARKEWAKAWNIQPPHPVGVKVKTPRGNGVIAGVYEHEGATYLIKEDRCKQEGRHILIKFEDVALVELHEKEVAV
jgi:hypothetical protein